MSWAPINRGKGQSFSTWKAINHKEHVQNWIDYKKYTKTWLPKAEFENLTGRPGRKD
jgi:hypothetical protein